MLSTYANCDLDRWSKLEVDDVQKKLGVDVSMADYFLKPGMNIDERLVRLFDNKSPKEMAEIGVQKGVMGLSAVEATEVLVSQLTQENTLTRDRDVVGALGADGGDNGNGDIDIKDVVGLWLLNLGMETEQWLLWVMNLGMEGKVPGKTTNKGKRKVDAADLAEDEAAEIPFFVDSDYDLSDHVEDETMAAEVEGWKRVVHIMATHPTNHHGDTSDSIELPSDSPSSESEDEPDQDEDKSKHVSKRYKAGTDLK